VHLTGTLINLCLYLAWMQIVHIESSCVCPSIRDFIVIGFIWASRRGHILDSGIVRDFRVNLVLAAIGAHDDSIVGSIVGCVVGSIVHSAIGSELSLFLFFLVVKGRSAIAETMIYMPSISFPARLQEHGQVMEHFPF